MGEKTIRLAIAALAVLAAAATSYIFRENAAAKDVSMDPLQPEIRRDYTDKVYYSQLEEMEKWRDKIRGRIDRGDPLLPPDFDLFFDDRFFAERQRPFAEMEEIRGQVERDLKTDAKALFNSYWDKWFEQRMKMGQFRTVISRSDHDLTLTIRIPGLAAGTADVSITADRIKISFVTRSVSEVASSGGMLRKETSQGYIKVLPLPEDAVPGTGKAETEDGSIRIRFDRKLR